MHEFELIKNYFSKIAKKNKSALNLNDDVFFDKKKGVVISVDTYNISTHFLNFKSPDLVIKKILRSSISDLICKGVKPKFYFISSSGNKKTFTKNNLYKISKSLSSAKRTCIDSESTSEWTATVEIPHSLQALIILTAISPLFAIKIFLNIIQE